MPQRRYFFHMQYRCDHYTAASCVLRFPFFNKKTVCVSSADRHAGTSSESADTLAVSRHIPLSVPAPSPRQPLSFPVTARRRWISELLTRRHCVTFTAPENMRP